MVAWKLVAGLALLAVLVKYLLDRLLHTDLTSEQKATLQVSDLIDKFHEVAGEAFAVDRLLLETWGTAKAGVVALRADDRVPAVRGSPIKSLASPADVRFVACRLACAVLVALATAVVLISPAAASEQYVSSESTDGVTTEPIPAWVLARGMAEDSDHIVQVLSWLRYRAPQRRVVYLLGGSATRESIISESDWAAQVRKITGKSATTYVCAKSCQTFVEDALIVNELPKGRGSVLISVGASRFIMLHEPMELPQHSIRRTPPVAWYQHHYDRVPSLSYAQKRSRVRTWLEESYPLFLNRYEQKLTELETVIKACEDRGLRVALLEMPLNLPVIGDDFDEALATYRRACLDLANQHGIEYIRFVTGIGLVGTDFHDLQHLLPSGRKKWQARLSRELVRRHLL